MSQDSNSQRFGVRKDGVQEEVIAAIPQGGGDTVLEVALMHDGASSSIEVELRYLVWGSGLGWYRQHTLTLDSTATRKLLRTLGIVQRRLEARIANGMGRTVIPFPHGRQAGRATKRPISLSKREQTEARSTGSQR